MADDAPVPLMSPTALRARADAVLVREASEFKRTIATRLRHSYESPEVFQSKVLTNKGARRAVASWLEEAGFAFPPCRSSDSDDRNAGYYFDDSVYGAQTKLVIHY